MSIERTARLALAVLCATVWGCSSATSPEAGIDGTFVLEGASGRGPATGSLILTRQGYAERRVRFAQPNGGLSKEYLARGTVTVNADGTIELELREMDGTSRLPWTPDAELVNGKVQIRHADPDGPEIVETYRRQ